MYAMLKLDFFLCFILVIKKNMKKIRKNSRQKPEKIVKTSISRNSPHRKFRTSFMNRRFANEQRIIIV